MPTIYAEIDGNDNFARLYLDSTIGDEVEMVVDLGFSYPDNVNATEPEEYKNFSDVIQEIFLGMSGDIPVDIDNNE